jgi:hypothetical protein
LTRGDGESLIAGVVPLAKQSSTECADILTARPSLTTSSSRIATIFQMSLELTLSMSATSGTR